MVAPGSVEQLEKFLELRPAVPTNLMFVDTTPSFAAHRGVGIGSLLEGPPPDMSSYAMEIPDLAGAAGVFSWVSNFMDLSPKNLDGVRLLGATLVVDGSRVIFASADRVPGDYPKPAEVMAKIEAASVQVFGEAA